jgi:methionyl aminopeptidase
VGELSQALDELFDEVEAAIRVGASTHAIARAAAEGATRLRVRSTFRNHFGFPDDAAVGVNDTVINGIPGRRLLTDGDLVNVQIGVTDGHAFAHQAWSYCVGLPRPSRVRLIEVAARALDAGVALVVPGASPDELAAAMQDTLEASSYSGNPHFVGHGIGRHQRELPQIPCVRPSEPTPYLLEPGRAYLLLVVAHEGHPDCVVTEDGWNVQTSDGTDAVALSRTVFLLDDGRVSLSRQRPLRV